MNTDVCTCDRYMSHCHERTLEWVLIKYYMVIAYRLHYGIVANCPSNFIPNGLPNISKMGHIEFPKCVCEKYLLP